MNFKERVRRKNEFDTSLVYGTRKFNLLTKQDQHLGYREKHDSQWLNSQTNLIYDKFAEERNCPLCGTSNFHTLFVKCGFPHLKCNVCGLTYVNPILNEAESMKLCRSEVSYVDVLKSRYQVKMQTLEARYILDILRPYFKSENKISVCDIGCGTGILLDEAKKKGYYAFAIEPNTRHHKSLEDKGIEYRGVFFPLKHDLGREFDCVFLLQVLEHMRNPLEVLLEAKKVLKKSGLIYIATPNIDALVNRLMHKNAATFGGHTHIQFFNLRTLSMLLEKAGFKVKDSDTIITQMGTIKNYLSFKEPNFGEDPDRLEFITPELIYRNYLGGRLHLVGELQ